MEFRRVLFRSMIAALVAAVFLDMNAALIIIVSGVFGALYYNIYRKEGRQL